MFAKPRRWRQIVVGTIVPSEQTGRRRVNGLTLPCTLITPEIVKVDIVEAKSRPSPSNSPVKRPYRVVSCSMVIRRLSQLLATSILVIAVKE